MNRFIPLLLGCLVVLAALTCGIELANPDPVSALGTSNVQTYTGTITGETTVITGAEDTSLSILAADITAVSTAGVWTFSDGTGGSAVWKVYLPADTPRSFASLFGSTGLSLTQNVLTATPPSDACTLALNVRTRDR